MKNLIRQILKEETSKQGKLKDMVLRNGWHQISKSIGGFENLYKYVFNNDYNEFLGLYDNLEVTDSQRENYKSKEIWVNERPLIIFDITHSEYMISQDKIWSFFENFGWDRRKIEKFLITWLNDTYGFNIYKAHAYSTLSPDNENL